jgi:excinuclease ABC subunit A
LSDYIIIKGARENNLKNISLQIPKNQLVVLTGLSGSGKSSLAFDTLQRECQRQYMESMGMVTDFISKPRVDLIEGLSPSISIDQHLTNRSPRSTVGTVTEIYTFLRILFAKLGQYPCPQCGKVIEPQFDLYNRADLESWAGDAADGGMTAGGDEGGALSAEDVEAFGNTMLCPHCQAQVPELTASHFSFNKPEGACPLCTGLGVVNDANLAMLIDEERSIADGAVAGWDIHYIKRYTTTFETAGKYYGFTFDPTIPVKQLGRVQRDLLLYGVLSPQFRKHFPDVPPPETASKGRFEGVVTNILRRYAERADDIGYREKMERVLIQQVCPECNGSRLREASRKVLVNQVSIVTVSGMSLIQLGEWIKQLAESLSEDGHLMIDPIIRDITVRLNRLIEVGVGYLALDRTAPTLAAGEAQRLRLALLLGSGLTGVLYVLDEPTTGLHARDTIRLIKVLKQLRDMGNTVLVIEHDLEMMRAADYIIDMGPGAGKNGGRIVAAGPPAEVAQCQASITGRHLTGMETITIPKTRRKGNGKVITIAGAFENNLKDVSVEIPLGKLVAVTGVSGSGKSSLIFDILDRAAQQYFNAAIIGPGKFERIEGLEQVDKLISIDQTPIGRTARSNAVTYTDAFTPIRNLFAELPAAKNNKLQAKHFSFNLPGGRCEKCQGAGVLTISMHFLPEVQVRCPVCRGRRFKREVLAVKYRGVNIADLLEMNIEEALPLFRDVRAVHDRLALMAEVGLDYLQLGQPANTLSGGEAQRIKLARELSRKGKGHTLYLVDEPTTGLHPHDVLKLSSLLQRLVDGGNTVVVIEHNLDIIRVADWIIDIGPEGGENGGRIVAEGLPEEVALVNESQTGRFLRRG